MRMNELEYAARVIHASRNTGNDDLDTYVGHDWHGASYGRYATVKFWRGSANPGSYGRHLFEVTVPLEYLDD